MIGLMSGTSGDGLDIAYCVFEKKDENWTFQIPVSETVLFPKKLGKKLEKADRLSGLKLSLLDRDFGFWMGDRVKDFVAEHQLEIDAVASHGHTVFHQPSLGLSLQIGNGWALHESSGLPVINDFRMHDVQLGGQGAPLVPIGDHLLFPQFDYCINLGGIANISMVKEGERVAFDVCPFNLLLNLYAAEFDLPFDRDGDIARSGKLIKKIFNKLNQLPYYQHLGPKSLGQEDLEQYLDILAFGEDLYKNKNILHTLVRHFAHQVARCIEIGESGKASILVTGGGAYNRFFIDCLLEVLPEGSEINLADRTIIDFKEALIFAFLGVLRLRGEKNCLASVTGARKDNCGGTVYGLQ